MKKCQGTFNYIFSSHSLNILKDLGLTNAPLSQEETSGYITQNIWLTDSYHSDFCIQFREIINEEEFRLGLNSSNVDTLAPGFLENKALIKSEVRTSPYKLAGLLLEDGSATREQLLQWEFPCKIFWFSPESGDLFHQLSYKKKFPFWAVILKWDDPSSIPDIGSTQINEVEFQNNKALWVHLETTSWDFLIIK